MDTKHQAKIETLIQEIWTKNSLYIQGKFAENFM